MAARVTPAKGSKPDKLWRDALTIAVKRPMGELDEPPRNRLAAMAEMLVAKAIEGDVQAAKEVGDRLDGKASQSVDITHNPGESLERFIGIIDRLNGAEAAAAVAASLAVEQDQSKAVCH